MSRFNFRGAIAGLTLATVACGVDHATAPRGDQLPSAAVGGSPSPLSASTVSDVSIGLSWVDNSPNEAGFEIHRSTTGPTGVFTRIATTTQKVTTYNDAGLTPLSQYCYEVRAYRLNGGKAVYTAFSNVACATTFGPPPAPTGVSASPREFGQVVVGWTSAATSFRIDRAATPGGPWEQIATPSASPYSDGGRAQEQLVCYRVSAVNQWGANPSTAACTTPPATPTNVAVSAPTGGGLDVTWSDVSAVEQGYEVQRATDNYVFATVGTAPANATRFHDATASFDVRYWYRVRATKDGGYTDFSSWADGIASSAAPSAPMGLSTIPTSSTSADIVWTSTSTNATGFRIERSADGGPWTTAATVPWSQTGFSEGGLTPEVATCYRVFAFNANGDSPPSSVDCSRPIAGPTDLASPSSTSDAVDLAWTDASAYETGYEVHRIECTPYYYYYYYSYCYVAESVTLGAGATSLHFAGLAPGTTYTFEVVAFAVKDGRTYYSDPSPQIYASTAP